MDAKLAQYEGVSSEFQSAGEERIDDGDDWGERNEGEKIEKLTDLKGLRSSELRLIGYGGDNKISALMAVGDRWRRRWWRWAIGDGDIAGVDEREERERYGRERNGRGDGGERECVVWERKSFLIPKWVEGYFSPKIFEGLFDKHFF